MLGLSAREACVNITLILAPGTWVSVYMCEAVMACDPWSILYLPDPKQAQS